MWKEGGISSPDTQCQPRGAVSKPVIPPISFEVSCCGFLPCSKLVIVQKRKEEEVSKELHDLLTWEHVVHEKQELYVPWQVWRLLNLI